MDIPKKAIMSFIVALTSVVSMAQPYYHIMKEENDKLTEFAGYNGKDYKIKIDMVKPEEKPDDAIGGMITIDRCSDPTQIRKFYFTNKGNLYYNNSTRKFYFEKSQLDYPRDFSMDHFGYFRWDKTLAGCIDTGDSYSFQSATRDDFYFTNPKNLRKLQEDLGNEKWTVLTICEWEYVLRALGEWGWEVDGETCFLIDSTPCKSLLRAIESKNGGKTMSKEDFEFYEAQGLVCLPATGYREGKKFFYQGTYSAYWSCSPNGGTAWIAWYLCFNSHYATVTVTANTHYYDVDGVSEHFEESRKVWGKGRPVRLVVLAD